MAQTAVSPAEPALQAARAATWWNAPMPERPLWKDALHVFAIFNFAVAYPMLDMIGQADWYYVVENADWLDIVMVAFVVSLLIPALLVGAIALSELVSNRLRSVVHASLIVLLFILGSFLTLISVADVTVAIAWGPALFLAAMVATFLYLRFDAVQSFATILILSVVAVPGYFLAGTDVSRLVFSGDTHETRQVTVNSEIPVVLIVYDELPLVSLLDENLKIDADRYPNFARFADDSYWFTNATTVQEATRHSLPAILSGTFPEVDNLPTAQFYPENLFSMLEHSHDRSVNEPATRLCAGTACEHPTRDLSTRVSLWFRSVLVPDSPPITTTRSRYMLDEDFVRSIQSSESPQLLFHHSLLPHFPWMHMPSGAHYIQTEPGTIGLEQRVEWGSDSWQVAHAYQRHLLQVEYIDKLFGELLDETRAAGIYDDALIIVTADHGISFSTGQSYRRFEDGTRATILPVPLFVKLPGQSEGEVSDRNAQTIDILPTIADVLDVEHDWVFDGISVFDESHPVPSHKTVVAGTGEHLELPPRIDGVERSVFEKIETFGNGSEHESLFRIGEYRDLVGVEVEDLARHRPSGFRVSLDYPDRYLNLDLNGDSIPAFVQGTLDAESSDVESETYLAVAVNGVIRAVTRTYQDGGSIRFGAMVPEQAFVHGTNHVEILVISGSADETEVRLVEPEATT